LAYFCGELITWEEIDQMIVFAEGGKKMKIWINQKI
jgi:hypothetical protein